MGRFGSVEVYYLENFIRNEFVTWIQDVQMILDSPSLIDTALESNALGNALDKCSLHFVCAMSSQFWD